MMRIASEFGFTPAIRSRIAAPAGATSSLFDLLEELRWQCPVIGAQQP
jgi:hypothetical protein